MTGWFTPEVGRQPWGVYNMLRTDWSVRDLSCWPVFSSL
ncbi:cytochrome ubiquinol oxidase subunit I, partial [Francisella tularensis subsp. holarctica]|nr:cytochrome ubiquinol oxidase subunit I [Francisella tularensis subsp. holarctica]